MRSPLNRTSAPTILRFFDLCFKQGVIDAYEFANDYDAKVFWRKHKEAWDFGVLGEPDDYDWEMWRFTLYRWGRLNHFTKFTETYIYKITKKNYLWYILPYCMRFYLMGIEEWLDYPAPQNIERFKKESKIHWKPMPSHLRKITKNDWISYMQEFVYTFRRSPLSEGEDRVMSWKTFDAYEQAIHDLTRGYDTEKKICFGEEEDKDI